MTDATSTANDHMWGAESVRETNPEIDDTSGNGDPAEGEIPAAPDSGGATARSGRPGVASPAGWFLSATGEAAPPVQPGTEPARADAGDTGIQAPDSSPPDMSGTGVTSTNAATADVATSDVATADVATSDIATPDIATGSFDDASADVREADEPSSGDRGDYDYWDANPQPAPVRQIPHQPSASDRGDYDYWDANPQPAPARQIPLQKPSRPASEASSPGSATWAGPWLEPPGLASWAPLLQARPSAGQAAHRPEQSSQSALPKAAPEPLPEPLPRRPSSPAAWAGPWQEPPGPSAPPAPDPDFPVLGPTAAVRGRAGGPGFALPPEAKSRNDPPSRSGWQLARGVWQESGIDWEPPAEPEPGSSRSAYPPNAFPVQSGQANSRPPALPSPPPAPPTTAFPAMPLGAPTLAEAESAFPAMPLGAPTLADAPAPTLPKPMPGPVRRRPPEPDELFQAWRGSVREASGGQKRTGRRRYGWQVVRAGVPIAVIVTVGAGAVMMLTGKTNNMLTDHAGKGTPTPGARGGVAIIDASGTLTGSAFSGYRGQRGALLISAIASAGGTRLAAGSADGHPAIWRRAGNGAWTLVSATSPAVFRRPGDEKLTGIAHGAAGWIAVGDVVSGAVQQSIVLTSADGMTWRALDNMAPFAGSDTYVTAVTAGPDGYVVVGKQVMGGRVYAAMWWSADLRNWVLGGNGGLDGRLEASIAYAVVPVPAGFVAAGTHGHCHSVWTSPDGLHWQVHDVLVPPGATSAMLDLLAVNGSKVVAAGYAVMKTGHVPIVVVSVDGGRHWRQTVLTPPGEYGAVTAITAAGTGFVAAGQVGQPGATRAITWNTADGQHWSASTPPGVGAQLITALTITGTTVTGTVQHGTDPSVVTLPTP